MTDLNDAERVRRGHDAGRALAEFLEPAFAIVQGEYLGRLQEIAAKTPWDAGPITALANAQRIAGEVKAQITGLVLDGKAAQGRINRARRIEEMNTSPAARRLLTIGPGDF